MKRTKTETPSLKFHFDISAYRLIGRELITDRITALFEIVKNSYDANANQVEIQFVGGSEQNSPSAIIIADDGMGMNLEDLKSRWMVIGTSSKRRETVSPSPYHRKVVGKKGIGRFAVDLLGEKLTLRTKKKGEPDWLCLETDWSAYSDLETRQLLLPFDNVKTYFTDVDNRYWFEPCGDPAEHGTTIQIERLNDTWTQYDVKRACKELAKLVSPNLTHMKYPFGIVVRSPFEGQREVNVKPLSMIEFSTLHVHLDFSKERNKQEVAMFEDGKLVVIENSPKVFGFVKFSLYYFDQQAKRKFKDKFQIDIDGVKIYRDGILTTPFAESEENVERQKDIIGLDKRRYSGFFEKLNTRDLMGFLEITEEDNPNIRESTNRQDFLDNPEWRALKAFIIDQVKQFERVLKHKKEQAQKTTKRELNEANKTIHSMRQLLVNTVKTAPQDMREPLRTVEVELGKLQGTVSKGIRDFAKLEEESRQKQDMFFSLVSLQTYAAMLSHMTKHTIGHILRDAEYFKDNFPNDQLNDRFKTISHRIYSEMINLRTGVDYMLRYAQTDSNIEPINLYELIHRLFFSIYADKFEDSGIQVELDLSKDLILNYNRKAIEDIFDNLITNSIKALQGVKNKRIKCSGLVEENALMLYFSDNGVGISPEDRQRVFEIFFTTTGEEGGAGIGLYMVKTRIEAMKGTIEITDSEFSEGGVTFKIVLPFNKSNPKKS